MTSSELKAKVEASGRESEFFTRRTMRFFGDTMRNYGVRGPVTVETYTGKRTCYELYRRRPVKHGNTSSAYFDTKTFARIFPKR